MGQKRDVQDVVSSKKMTNMRGGNREISGEGREG